MTTLNVLGLLAASLIALVSGIILGHAIVDVWHGRKRSDRW